MAHFRTVALVVVAAVVATGTIGIGTASAAPVTNSGHGAWERLSLGTTHNFTTPDLLRLPNGSLLAGWQETAGTSGPVSVSTAVLSGSKMKIGARGTVASNWSEMDASPQFALVGGTVVAGYVGIHSLDTMDTLNGSVLAANSTDGITWTQDARPLTGDKAGGTYGLDLVNTAAGPVTAFIETSTDAIGYHVGYAPSLTVDDNTRIVSATGGDVLYVSLARDAATGSVFAAWYVLGGTSPGIKVQQVWPTAGPVIQPPGQFTDGNSLAPDKAVAIASSSTGGVWVGYSVGYPSATAVRAFNPVTGKTVTVAKGQTHVQSVDLSGGPSGSIWASWADATDGGHLVRAARSNPGVTRFGAVSSIVAPSDRAGNSSAYNVTGEGSTGPLDVVVSANVPNDPTLTQTALYSALVKPALTVTTSKKHVSSKKRGTATVTVTDAGVPVKGATVSFAGHRHTTNAKGKAVIVVKKGQKHSTKAITVKRAGYVTTVAKIRITS